MTGAVKASAPSSSSAIADFQLLMTHWCFVRSAWQKMTKLHDRVSNVPGKRGRSRPRKYNADVALEAALHAFWRRGYSDRPLDDLVIVTGMNCPGLYAAFGTKREIYRRALSRYWELARLAFARTLSGKDSFFVEFQKLFEAVIHLYRPSDDSDCHEWLSFMDK
jgi:hypothetical protein